MLLIEDDLAVKERVLAALADYDCHVTSAASGDEGVTRAIGLRPDLLILNLVLPDMAGAEVVRRVRAVDGLALLPAVFVSSDRYDAAHPESSAGVVLKPFLMSNLGPALAFAFTPALRISGDGAGDGTLGRDSSPS